jgi:hypothetical protein
VWSERVARQERGEAVLWITLEGFFWHPRRLFGVEDHFYAFYDEPELMHRINEDLTNQSLALLDALLPLGTPDFMTFAEDMSYNHGPMLSKELFDEFLRPYYLRLTGRLRDAGVRVFVDSDGDVTELVPWLKEAGVEGILPLERQAGVDVSALREDHPSFLLLGAFDKMTMDKGEEAMRAEFERLLPVMRGGGFLPSCDHQTPPAVSLEEYRLYLRLFREYAAKAGA